MHISPTQNLLTFKKVKRINGLRQKAHQKSNYQKSYQEEKIVRTSLNKKPLYFFKGFLFLNLAEIKYTYKQQRKPLPGIYLSYSENALPGKTFCRESHRADSKALFG